MSIPMLYNSTPSDAIVNAVCNISNRPLLEADDTDRCLCNTFYEDVDQCFNRKIMLTRFTNKTDL